jgi:hypothetical protein
VAFCIAYASVAMGPVTLSRDNVLIVEALLTSMRSGLSLQQTISLLVDKNLQLHARSVSHSQ